MHNNCKYTFGLLCVSFANVYQFARPYFPFGFEGGVWDLIVLIPDHCLSIYFALSSIIRSNSFFQPPTLTVACAYCIMGLTTFKLLGPYATCAIYSETSRKTIF